MKEAGRSKNTASIPKSVLSVKIGSVLLAGLLLVGTVPVTHSYPSAKPDFNNIWLAAKEFWDSLEFFKSHQQNEEDAQNIAVLDPIDSLNVDKISDVLRQGLEKLKNHPECRSIYIAEYLPTFNSQVIERCEKAIKRYEEKQLFDTYVKQLCMNTNKSSLSRKQVGEIQLRLRKYSLTFPQSDIDVAESQIDGLYGVKTCEIIANYQILSKVDAITGIADYQLYDDLAATIPLSETELAGLNWRKSSKPITVAEKKPATNETAVAKPEFKLPGNPFKRIAFCIKNSHVKQCKQPTTGIDLAKVDVSNK